MKYTYTNQKQIRAAFWEQHPDLSRKTVKSYPGKVYVADTRCAFVDFVDHLQKSDMISEALAQRATL